MITYGADFENMRYQPYGEIRSESGVTGPAHAPRMRLGSWRSPLGGDGDDDNAYLLESLHLLCYLHLALLLKLLLKRDDALLGRPEKRHNSVRWRKTSDVTL